MERELFVFDHPEFDRVARRYRGAIRRKDAVAVERWRRELRRLVQENTQRQAVENRFSLRRAI